MREDIGKPYLLRKSMSALLLSMGILLSLKSVGQTDTIARSPEASIKGRLFDSTQKKPCPYVAIMLLQGDSTLQSFIRSQKDGTFYLGHLSPGRYLLLFTQPDYSEYSFPITLKIGETKNFGNIGLPPKSDLLAAVTVTPTTATPRLHGDTLEYNVSHLRMKPNASVEEMLRRLPGVEIDQFGNITVNGQRVERLLVDGEDFFSGNASLVTRNFNADMINKVQVLDKRSKEAEFTGIDDGQKTKTLNLTLKDDSKKGYFGKAEAGADPQDYYSMNALLGAFRDRRQFAALGMDANNGSWRVNDNSGQTNAGISLLPSVADPLGASAGIGIPHTSAGTTHYANHWTKYDTHLSGDVQIGHLTTEPFSTSAVIQTLPNSLYAQRNKAASLNSQDQQALSIQYEFRPDSLNAMEISFEGSRAQGNNFLYSRGQSNFNDTIANSTMRQIISNVKNEMVNASLMWNIRGRKRRGCGFFITANVRSQDDLTTGSLQSIDSFYHKNGSYIYQDSIDQRKDISNKSLVLNSRVGYTEILSKNLKVGVSYGISLNRSKSFQSTFDKGQGGYDIAVDSLNNHYENTIFSHAMGLNVSGNVKKFGYLLGATIIEYASTQKDLLKNSTLRQPYTNLTPGLSFSYKLSAGKEIRLNYSGQTEQPSMAQLQPAINNNDPLHITIGNPNLQPGFIHFFEVNFSRVGSTSLYLGARYNFKANAFGVKIATDTLGRQISQTVNVDGNHEASVYMLIVNKIKKIELDYTVSPFAYYNRNVNYVGPLLDHSDNYKVGINVGINKYAVDKYSIQMHGMPIWYSFRSAVNPSQRLQYWTFNGDAGASFFLLKGFEINMTGNYAWQQKVSSLGQATSVLLWNAFISRNFLKNRLTVRWQVNDILNQNRGISRNINSNIVSENAYNTLERYWLLIVSFRFVHHSAIK